MYIINLSQVSLSHRSSFMTFRLFKTWEKKQYDVQEIHLLFSLPDVDETINFTLICFLCMKLEFDLSKSNGFFEKRHTSEI